MDKHYLTSLFTPASVAVLAGSMDDAEQLTPQALALRREPSANVERYDSLRSQTEGGRHAS